MKKLSPFIFHSVVMAVVTWVIWDKKHIFIGDSIAALIVFLLYWKVEAFRPYRSVNEVASTLRP